MEITSRQDAITFGRRKYFTGVPCKNGHVSERYTQSSVCLDCLHPKLGSSELRKRMETIRIALHPADLEEFAGIVLALSRIRNGALLEGDVKRNVIPKQWGGGTMLYTFKVFPEDKAGLFFLQEDFNFARLTPQQQQTLIDNQHRRMDGWVPPTTKAV